MTEIFCPAGAYRAHFAVDDAPRPSDDADPEAAAVVASVPGAWDARESFSVQEEPGEDGGRPLDQVWVDFSYAGGDLYGALNAAAHGTKFIFEDILEGPLDPEA